MSYDLKHIKLNQRLNNYLSVWLLYQLLICLKITPVMCVLYFLSNVYETVKR